MYCGKKHQQKNYANHSIVIRHQPARQLVVHLALDGNIFTDSQHGHSFDGRPTIEVIFLVKKFTYWAEKVLNQMRLLSCTSSKQQEVEFTLDGRHRTSGSQEQR